MFIDDVSKQNVCVDAEVVPHDYAPPPANDGADDDGSVLWPDFPHAYATQLPLVRHFDADDVDVAVAQSIGDENHHTCGISHFFNDVMRINRAGITGVEQAYSGHAVNRSGDRRSLNVLRTTHVTMSCVVPWAHVVNKSRLYNNCSHADEAIHEDPVIASYLSRGADHDHHDICLVPLSPPLKNIYADADAAAASACAAANRESSSLASSSYIIPVPTSPPKNHAWR